MGLLLAPVALIVGVAAGMLVYNWIKPRTGAQPDTTREWVLFHKSEAGRTEVYNLNGLSWRDAPIPPRFHRCYAQTYGISNWFTVVLRCPCGGVAFKGGTWGERNSRKKEQA